MSSLLDTSTQALRLLLTADPELWQIVGVSFTVSGLALALCWLPALLLGFGLAYLNLPARWLWLTALHTLQSIPSVVIGLLLYMLLSRSGPLGDWQWLFTQQGMIAGQVLIGFPVIASMSHATFQHSDRRAFETALTLSGSRLRAFRQLCHECRFGLLAAGITAFSRVITEVGCATLVGGNILYFTRNITTAIALETQKGAFTQGIALGMVLLALALALNLLLSLLQGRAFLRT
ncbi:ABC transporter permease [Aeromonas simiae]|uniref:ABC transporter permease n=1 Tax=Aeromonas simiae TaxID=218936 RepID=UPI0005A98816|nr:ABC transporter permease [Aeromonas simiae]MDO2947410.1 ABC transporter permease [Aeromonas simiae]MDO2951041.1 ABC transporter permease [Aeromonas simiae]MDO2954634.1 ABC transporter permease [Aeromonas simiae]